jgi:hypothetical protein
VTVILGAAVLALPASIQGIIELEVLHLNDRRSIGIPSPCMGWWLMAVC